MIRSPRQQLDTFRALIQGKRLERTSPTFGAALRWMRLYPGELSDEELTEFRTLVCSCWGITLVELDDALASPLGEQLVTVNGRRREKRWTEAQLKQAKEDEDEFDELVPREGIFRDWIEYTRQSEGPILFHFYTMVVGIAATVNRRCGFSMGPVASIFPPIGVMLLGPSGIKKTSSSDILVDILIDQKIVPLYSEKVTPEALIEGMAKGQANGLIYAPELAVFLGKATYMDGIVPLLTRLMDSPNKWTTETISRGAVTLKDVALTCLMCSTSDWFVSNTSADMFGGGFIARNILVYQTISPRIIPIPTSRDDGLRLRITSQLLDVHALFGSMTFEPRAYHAYIEFYKQNKMDKPEHEMLEAYYQRKGSHAIRVAMILHLATHGTYEICLDCFLRTLQILEYTERYLPALVQTMFRTEAGLETEKVLRVIQSFPGPIPHSALIRRMQYAMNAQQVNKVLKALGESGQIKEHRDKFSHTYQLKEEEEDGDT